MNKLFGEGFYAYLAEESFGTCPYLKGDDRKAWENGWWAATGIESVRNLTEDETRALASLVPPVMALVEALRAVEWVTAVDGGSVCPWCAARVDDGHEPDCSRQTALAALDGKEEDDGEVAT